MASVVRLTPLAEAVWQAKYRRTEAERSIADTRRRVARAIAAAEPDAPSWETAFTRLLDASRFLPGGRVWAGAGTDLDVTLFNCFVAGPVGDSMEAITDALRETAVTLQHGGGVGLDFSPLRPLGSPARRTGQVASGPVSFMHVWNALSETVLCTGSRRGAMMGTLRCDHPDVATFVDAKRAAGALENFNLSVLATDAFMRAVRSDGDWALVHPAVDAPERRVRARSLWRQIARTAQETAEPGVLFVDTINRENNLSWCETISATNPCGEIPLPPYGACNLGSLNLTAFVRKPFAGGDFAWDALREAAAVAVRFLDDVIDVSRFPLEPQARHARSTRRIGIGVTGLADALAMCGLHYDSDEGRRFAVEAMTAVRDACYGASVALAREKGPFPLLERDRYLAVPFIRRLPPVLRDAIARDGIRNSHLLAVAPAGTISLLAGNVSSGIEPIYALETEREVRGPGGERRRLGGHDFAYARWLDRGGARDALPDSLVTGEDLAPRAHLAMQACLQPLVDSAISKTINLRPDASVADVEGVFASAFDLGLKGCTVFRPGTARGQVIRAREETHCCNIDREAD